MNRYHVYFRTFRHDRWWFTEHRCDQDEVEDAKQWYAKTFDHNIEDVTMEYIGRYEQPRFSHELY